MIFGPFNGSSTSGIFIAGWPKSVSGMNWLIKLSKNSCSSGLYFCKSIMNSLVAFSFGVSSIGCSSSGGFSSRIFGLIFGFLVH